MFLRYYRNLFSLYKEPDEALNTQSKQVELFPRYADILLTHLNEDQIIDISQPIWWEVQTLAGGSDERIELFFKCTRHISYKRGLILLKATYIYKEESSFSSP